MPDVIRDDMAFIDRLHFYLPGWEIPKMRPDLFTSHYGFVVDYLRKRCGLCESTISLKHSTSISFWEAT